MSIGVQAAKVNELACIGEDVRCVSYLDIMLGHYFEVDML
jgi:hypothetical protein